MFGKLIPKYSVTNAVGSSSTIEWTWGIKNIVFIVKSGKVNQNLNREYELDSLNPFRDLVAGGTKVGSYWFADDTVVGYVLRKIFK